MNGRKRNDYSGKREDERERKSERSELRPPDTSTLPPPLTLPTLITQTSLNTIQNTIFHNILCNTLNTICATLFSTLTRSSTSTFLYTIYSNTTIFSFRLSSSSSTEFTLEAEHVTPFNFTFCVI